MGRNVCVVLGFDINEKVFEVKYEEENENYVEKYIRRGGNIIWEKTPPQCSKCCKTNAVCSLKCYNFTTCNNMKEIVNKHKSQQRTRKDEIDAEIQKIEDMKRDGREYKSWLYTSLFESVDNTERMVFV